MSRCLPLPRGVRSAAPSHDDFARISVLQRRLCAAPAMSVAAAICMARALSNEALIENRFLILRGLGGCFVAEVGLEAGPVLE